MRDQAAVPDRLPLLDAFMAERAPTDEPLRDVTAVLVQHQTGSIVPMLKALAVMGLDLNRAFFVDIPYSTHSAVVEVVRRLGVPDRNLAGGHYRLDDSLSGYQLGRVAELLRRLRQRVPPEQRVLVLDDGAYVLEAMSLVGPPSRRLAVVEQTVFGMRKLREDERVGACRESVPVINVAESRPKKVLEADFLGTAIAGALARPASPVLERLRAGRTLLLGYGAIGSAVARSLCEHVAVPRSSVSVGDPSADARRRASRDGFALWSRGSHERNFDVVIGCSGRASFLPEDVRFVEDGAYLASASSGTVELSRDAIFTLANGTAQPAIFVHGNEPLGQRGLHSDVRVHVFDRDVVILNGGFPVDFDGTINGAAGDAIQLTRTLMVGGALQALTARPGSVHELEDSFVEWVERRFRELAPRAKLARE
jgi:S-adenosylhomocysteine hydrolase